MKLVVDASVAIKWMIRDVAEANIAEAVAILRCLRTGTVEAVQPPHWTAEILAVIARSRPRRVNTMVGLLAALPHRQTASIACYLRAAELAIALNHHLFDTLYHAVALEEGATLVTADEAYFAKAKGLDAIIPLAEFAL